MNKSIFHSGKVWKILFLLPLLACSNSIPAYPDSLNGIDKAYVCDASTNQGANCLKPNADGSINTALGGTTSYTTTDKGSTITSGGTAQTAIASNASRKIWCIQNDPAETEVLHVRVGTTATATTGISLSSGAQACGSSILDTGIVSVIAATTSHRWFGFEGQ